ncbi:hypothetical protein LIER_40014 [Lithospermum erythrorhizon]|uniref:Reverse transcriptase Ty1/copia-type domain-containing protein n=1 Tax=Lithospermum erythrorhizon TaxID=34254 RepID=A0AAV3QN21_LITER
MLKTHEKEEDISHRGQPLKQDHVPIGDGGKGKIVEKGQLNVNGLPHLTDVLLVEGLTVNLISVLNQGMKISEVDDDVGTTVTDTCPDNTSESTDGTNATDKSNDIRSIQPANRIQKNHPVDNIIGKLDQGFVDDGCPQHVYRLKKALYGLKRAPQAWYVRLTRYLLGNGYACGGADKTLFIKYVNSNLMLAQIYVDDIILEGILVNGIDIRIKGNYGLLIMKRREEELVLNPTPIRSEPLVGTTQEVTQDATPLIHNFYLPWVDYTNVRELNNPKHSFVSHDDDDVKVDESHDEIPTMQDVIGEATTPIVEERVTESSCAKVTCATEVSEPSVLPTIDNTTGKIVEPSFVSEKSADVASDDNLKWGNVDVSHVDDMVTEEVKIPSTEGLGDSIDLSVKDNMNGMKESAPTKGDVVRSTVIDIINDHVIIEGMDVVIPSASGFELVTARSTGVDETPSVTDSCAETADLPEVRTIPTIGQGVADTLNTDVEELIPEDAGQEKKSKKKKHKAGADAGESSEA